MSKMRILIVEDEPVIAEHISIYLDNHDFEVSGIAYDSDEAIEQLQSNTPDAAILDVNLSSEPDGIDIGRQINERFHLPFLFLTSYSDKETIQRAKLVKPGGYIVKPFNEKTLLASLEIAISNYATERSHELPPLSMVKLNKQMLSPLSEREFGIVQLAYQGITNSLIAERLFVSVNTVKTHLKNIFLKLDVNSRIDLINKLRNAMLK